MTPTPADQPPPLPPRHVDYATPQPRDQRPWTSIPLTIALAWPTVLIYVACFIVVPRFEMIFKDFKTELTRVTQLTLMFARWVTRDFGWAVLWLIPVVVPVVLALGGVVGRPGGSRRLRVLTATNISILLMLIVLLFLALGLLMPMISLIQSVASPKK